jgi:paraquat-inducible protein B
MENDLNLQVCFNQNPGLTADDPVFFKGRKVGAVKKITYTNEGNYLTDILVEAECKNSATVDSQFYSAKNPNSPDKYNMVIEQTTPGGALLEDGTIVKGVDKRSFMEYLINDLTTNLKESLKEIKREYKKNSTYLESGIEESINSISAKFGKFKEKISQVPKRKEVKELEKSLQQLYDNMLRTEKSIRINIQTKILPKIEKEVQHLKKRLAPSGRTEEVTPLESDLEKIKTI